MASNPFLFGCSTDRLTRAESALRRRVAAKHDCVFYMADGRHWFATKFNQLGYPFDQATAAAVLAEIVDRR